MSVSEARRVEEDGQHDCPLCDSEAPYVLFDGDKMCENCGHTPGADGGGGTASSDDEWADWREHRADMYEGFYGPDRIKFPGGFASAYVFEDDF
jgi:hypothetical protein